MQNNLSTNLTAHDVHPNGEVERRFPETEECPREHERHRAREPHEKQHNHLHTWDAACATKYAVINLHPADDGFILLALMGRNKYTDCTATCRGKWYCARRLLLPDEKIDEE